MIFACARTKLEIVAADERDSGRRAVLNLGHTVGHAIEAASGYERYRHGEAVGLGLLAALRLSGADELRDEVARPARPPRPADPARPRDRRRGRPGGGRARQEAHRRRGGLRAPRASRRAGDRPARRPGQRPRRRGGAAMRNRVEVMHGVNLDILGRRDPEHYGTITLPELEVKIKRFAHDLELEVTVLPDQPRGRVRRAPPSPARGRRRGAAQPRRLDPLQLRDPRRARDRGAAGRRGPPLRRPLARGVAAPLGARGPGRSGPCRGRGPTATARRSRC